MVKQKRPRQKAQTAKTEAKKSAATVDTKMEVDSKEVAVSDMKPKGVSFKNTKAKLEGQLTKTDKRALRQRMLMQKLIVGGSGAKPKESVEDADDDDEEESFPSDVVLKRLEKRKQNLKTKDKPIKKAHQRSKQYIHNVLKITTQVNKKTSKDMTHEDISERVKNLVAKLQQ